MKHLILIAVPPLLLSISHSCAIAVVLPGAGAWNFETVVSTSGFSRGVSGAVVNGRPALSHYFTPVSLAYSVRNGSWSTEDAGQSLVTGDTSLAVFGANPAIAHSRNDGTSVAYTFFNGAIWQTEVVDNTLGGSAEHSPSLINLDGYPAIVYDTSTALSGELRYATNSGSGWSTVKVDDGAVDSSRAIQVIDGKPSIVYTHRTGTAFDGLNFAQLNGLTWDISTIDVDGRGGQLAETSLGPSVVYYTGAGASALMRFAYYDGSTWNTETIASVGQIASRSITSVGGVPVVALGTTDEITLAERTASGWRIINTGEDPTGSAFSIAVFTDGSKVYVGYEDAAGIDRIRFAQVRVIPEPSTLTLFPLGLIAVIKRRRRK